MAFYDLSKEERQQRVAEIYQYLLTDLHAGKTDYFLNYFADKDTYIRKSAYQAVGRIYHAYRRLHEVLFQTLDTLFQQENEHVRQTVINAAGEIGMTDFSLITDFMQRGLFDAHHCVRNAVIGSIKKMGEKNPEPTLVFARQFLHHEDKEIRREICHGIELRGRTHPQDILPLLRELQHDKTARVKNTLVHVLGQIAYKRGCLETVISDLQTWENKEVVTKAIAEIIDVHYRYRNFTFYTQAEAKNYIAQYFPVEDIPLGEKKKLREKQNTNV
jgi:hypothetical protein